MDDKQIEYLENLKNELKDMDDSEFKIKTLKAIEKKIAMLKKQQIVTK